jgi:dCTP diphosphatase
MTMMSIASNDDRLNALQERIRQFVTERDWAQFHSPKNLACALSVEAAELLEPFQWLATGNADEIDDKARLAIRHEMADVFTYLLMLADKMQVDLVDAANEKLALSAAKYPADQVRGDSRKYSNY